MWESVIRELETAFKTVNTIADVRDRELRLETLNRIERFIFEYPWSSSKNAELFKKYGKLSVKEFGRATKLKESNVRLINKRCSDKIRQVLGYNKIHTAVNGGREDVKRVINCITLLEKNIVGDYCIPEYILTKVSQNRASVDYLVSDLSSEIEFLKRHSKQAINRECEQINKDKLSYIFKVLNSREEGYLLDKKEAILSQILNKGGV